MPIQHGEIEVVKDETEVNSPGQEVQSHQTEFSDDTVVTAVDDQISCELADGSVILNLCDGIYYGLNSVGCRIWNLIQDPIAFKEIQAVLLDEYEVEPDKCALEIRFFLQEMVRKGLVEIRDGVRQAEDGNGSG